jgi:site-specific DNA-methyltransferase (adenine-specific)
MRASSALRAHVSRVIRGDATAEASYSALLQGRKAELLFSDPPYCLLERRRKGGDLRDARRGTRIDHETVLRYPSVAAYADFTKQWLALALSHCSRVAILWTNVLGKKVLLDQARAAGFGEVYGEFLWAKRTTSTTGNTSATSSSSAGASQQSSNGSSQAKPALITSEVMLRVYESALVLGRVPLSEAFPHLDPRRSDSHAIPWSVVTGYYDDEGASNNGTQGLARSHPHHKPLAALEPLVRTFSRSGDTVLDPFCGTGSLLHAASDLGRVAVGIELDSQWAELAQQRLIDRNDERGNGVR